MPLANATHRIDLEAGTPIDTGHNRSKHRLQREGPRMEAFSTSPLIVGGSGGADLPTTIKEKKCLKKRLLIRLARVLVDSQPDFELILSVEVLLKEST